VKRLSKLQLACLSIVKQPLETGRQPGVLRRSIGAVTTKNEAAKQPPACHMIALLAFLIGRRAGLTPRSNGAASMPAKAAMWKL